MTDLPTLRTTWKQMPYSSADDWPWMRLYEFAGVALDAAERAADQAAASMMLASHPLLPRLDEVTKNSDLRGRLVR